MQEIASQLKAIFGENLHVTQLMENGESVVTRLCSSILMMSFPGRIMSQRGDMNLPPRSPNLKENVYANFS